MIEDDFFSNHGMGMGTGNIFWLIEQSPKKC